MESTLTALNLHSSIQSPQEDMVMVIIKYEMGGKITFQRWCVCETFACKGIALPREILHSLAKVQCSPENLCKTIVFSCKSTPFPQNSLRSLAEVLHYPKTTLHSSSKVKHKLAKVTVRLQNVLEAFSSFAKYFSRSFSVFC